MERLIRYASEVSADRAVRPNFNIEDLDAESIQRYRTRHQNRDPASPLNDYPTEQFLRAIEVVKKDRSTGLEGLTLAGLLMFGRPDTIRDVRPRHLIDYRKVASLSASPGDLTGARWEERIAWEGNLFDAYLTIYRKITEDLPVRFRLEGTTRAAEGPIHEALREALANLLVHADYSESDASLILRAPEGFRLRNPGSSRVTEVDLRAGDHSDPRNPLLVAMFRRIGEVEEAGTGIPRILQAWRQEGWEPPRIDIGLERYEFAMELRYTHLLSDEDRAWLDELGDSWLPEERMALVFAKHHGYVDNATLRDATGHHPADISKVLSGLARRGVMQKVGGGAAVQYELVPEATPDGTVAEEERGMARQAEAQASAHWDELIAIAAPLRVKRRVRDKDLRDSVITRLCSIAPLTLPQLMELLNKGKDSVREAVQELIASGKLAYLYPDRVSHPQQAYTTLLTEPQEPRSS